MSTPRIAKYSVYPVAGRDSMELNLSGAHAPYFTRNILVLEDTQGNVGLGEVPGGERITANPAGVRAARPRRQPRRLPRDPQPDPHRVRRPRRRRPRSADLRPEYDDPRPSPPSSRPSSICWASTSSVPVAALLGGDGQQRESVRMLGYLFYIGDRNKTDLDYLGDERPGDRLVPAPPRAGADARVIVRLAEAAARASTASRTSSSRAASSTAPRKSRRSPRSSRVFPMPASRSTRMAPGHSRGGVPVRDLHGVLAYAEDPCGAEHGFSGREIMAEFRKATGLPTATNMVATDWRQLGHAIKLRSVDIPLADPHFWTHAGLGPGRPALPENGLTWGSHSNNHFDISLAMFTQVGAAAPGDTPRWTRIGSGRRETSASQESRCGSRTARSGFPTSRALASRSTWTSSKPPMSSTSRQGLGGRDDAAAMQYLIPGWTFDNKTPCLVR